jgi:hypothetical protein
MARFIPLALALPLLAGCAANAMESASGDDLSERDQRRMAVLLDDKVPGEPESCITLRPTTQSSIIGDRMVLYRNGTTVYANDFDGQCSNLRSDSTIVTSTPSNRLCSGDIAEIRDPHSGISFGSCAYGEFTPYRPG